MGGESKGEGGGGGGCDLNNKKFQRANKTADKSVFQITTPDI